MERINLKLVMDRFGFDLQQISFDKGGPRYGSLKGGQVDALFEQPGDVRGFLDSGDFKPILTLLKERPAAFAEVPAMGDVGLTFKPLMRFRGFYVKKGAIVHPVSEMNIAGSHLELWNRLVEVGNDPWVYGSNRTPTLRFSDVQCSGSKA